jgi:hypothetical protein
MALLVFGLDCIMTEEYLVHVQARCFTSYLLGGSNTAWMPSLHKQEARNPLALSSMIGFSNNRPPLDKTE